MTDVAKDGKRMFLKSAWELSFGSYAITVAATNIRRQRWEGGTANADTTTASSPSSPPPPPPSRAILVLHDEFSSNVCVARVVVVALCWCLA
jgi:hypothetical protein